MKIGCLAAEGIDYVSLGKDTGKMAAKILKGEVKAEDMGIPVLTESNLYVNEKVAENLWNHSSGQHERPCSGNIFRDFRG